jgi:hypothetical protein
MQRATCQPVVAWGLSYEIKMKNMAFVTSFVNYKYQKACLFQKYNKLKRM